MGAGRPAGQRDTRQQLLRAAVQLFGERGYQATSVRMITDSIGVDPALVRHYFGGKEGLFREAVLEQIDAATEFGPLLAHRTENIGEQVVRAYLSIWKSSKTQPLIHALLRTALESEETRDLVAQVLSSQISRRLPDLPHCSEQRLALAGSQLIGLGLVRYVLRFEPVASMSTDEVVHYLAPTLQRLLVGDEETG